MKENFPICFPPCCFFFLFLFDYLLLYMYVCISMYICWGSGREALALALFTPQICLKSKSSIIKLFPLDWCLLINYATNNILITSIIVTTGNANICMYVSTCTPYFLSFIYFGYKKKLSERRVS